MKKVEKSNKTFVFTGSLEIYTRKMAQDLVESRGARASSSVSKNTDYVVAGDGAADEPCVRIEYA